MRINSDSSLKVLLIDPFINESIMAIPLSVGVIGSYLKDNIPDIELKILKTPSSIIKYIEKEKPDVLGICNYLWNTNLGNRISRFAREINPNLLLVFGGPDVNPNPLDVNVFTRKYSHADLLVVYEGEIPFTNIIKTYIDSGKDKSKIRQHIEELGNCFYIDQSGNFIKGPSLPSFKDVDLIPSPYTMGLFDEFLEQNNFFPIVQTNRGCPYGCTFCQTGDSYYNKTYFHSLDYVIEELDYIAERVSPSSGLFIVDTNWGMWPQDLKIAQHLRHLQETKDWPRYIDCDTGKSQIKRIKQVAKLLRGTMVFSNSVQSMNENVLKNIKRKNLPHLEEEIKEFNVSQQRTELILPLPGETKETFLTGLKKLMDTRASLRFAVYPALLLSNTELDNAETVKKYDLKMMYRQHQNLMGYCAGEFVCETERVVVSTSTMSVEEVLFCRSCSVLLDTLLRYEPLYELFKYLDGKGIERSTYILTLLNSLFEAPADIQKCLDEYNNCYYEEMEETEEAVIRKMEQDAKDYQLGKKGGDLLKYSVLLWHEHYNSMIDWIFNTLRTFAKKEDGFLEEVRNLEQFIRYLYYDRDEQISEKTPSVSSSFDYDFLQWVANPEPVSLNDFKNPTNYIFKQTDSSGIDKRTILQSFGFDKSEDGESLSSETGEGSRYYMSKLRRGVGYENKSLSSPDSIHNYPDYPGFGQPSF